MSGAGRGYAPGQASRTHRSRFVRQSEKRGQAGWRRHFSWPSCQGQLFAPVMTLGSRHEQQLTHRAHWYGHAAVVSYSP